MERTDGKFLIKGMTCSSCCRFIEDNVRNNLKNLGKISVLDCFSIDLVSETAFVSLLGTWGEKDLEEMISIPVSALGFECHLFDSNIKPFSKKGDMLLKFRMYGFGNKDHTISCDQILQFLRSYKGVISATIDNPPCKNIDACNDSDIKDMDDLTGTFIYPCKLSIYINADVGGCHPAYLYKNLQEKFNTIYFDYQDPLDQRYKCQLESILRARDVAKWRKRAKIAIFIAVIEIVVCMLLSNFTWFTTPMSPSSHGLNLSILIECLLSNILMFGPVGKSFFGRARRSLLFHRHITMDALIMLGSGVSWFFSMLSVTFCLLKPVPIHSLKMMHSMIFFDTSISLLSAACLGRYLETLAKSKTLKELHSIIFHAKPLTASVLIDFDINSARIRGTTNPLHHNEVLSCPSSLLMEGDVVIVKNGECVPVDGRIVDIICGSSANTYQIFLDESNLTGESNPVCKNIDDDVYAGTLLKGTDMHICIRATNSGINSFCNKLSLALSNTSEISRLSETKKRVFKGSGSIQDIQNLANKISSLFFPIILSLGLVACVFWLLVTTIFGYKPRIMVESGEIGWVFSLKIFISVITISCPCILGLVMPTITVIGAGLAAKHKILLGHLLASNTDDRSDNDAANIADGGYHRPGTKRNIRSIMDIFNIGSNITAVMFDKTGTLTTGHVTLKNISWNISWLRGESKDWKRIFCEGIALAERESRHPVGKAIYNGLIESLKRCPIVTDGNSLRHYDVKIVNGSHAVYSGLGIECKIEVASEPENLKRCFTLLIGNKEWMKRNEVFLYRLDNVNDTSYDDEYIRFNVYIAWDGIHIATTELIDEIHPDSFKLVKWLHERGYKTGILTGDDRSTALRVANQLGIPVRNVYASLSCEQKGKLIHDFQNGIAELVYSSSYPHGDEGSTLVPLNSEFIQCGGVIAGNIPITPVKSILKADGEAKASQSGSLDIESDGGSLKTVVNERVMMVGDGVNDSLALERSDVGVVFCRQHAIDSASRSDSSVAVNLSAIFSANVTIFGNSIASVATFLDLSKRTCKRLAWNFLWGCIYNMVSIPIAMGMLLPLFEFTLTPIISSVTMTLSSLSVLLSSMMLVYFYRPPIPSTNHKDSSRPPNHIVPSDTIMHVMDDLAVNQNSLSVQPTQHKVIHDPSVPEKYRSLESAKDVVPNVPKFDLLYETKDPMPQNIMPPIISIPNHSNRGDIHDNK